MKRLALVFVAVTLFASSLAFAATPVAEPTLPADLETAWKTYSAIVCNKHAGKSLVEQVYVQQSRTLKKLIVSFSMNGKKVAQYELFRAPTVAGRVYYVKNSPDQNWLKYDSDEVDQAEIRLLAELGMTQTEHEECAAY